MSQMILKFISIIIITIAINFIYNSKDIVNKFFSNTDTNSNIKKVKTVGIVIIWIGIAIFYMTLI